MCIKQVIIRIPRTACELGDGGRRPSLQLEASKVRREIGRRGRKTTGYDTTLIFAINFYTSSGIRRNNQLRIDASENSMEAGADTVVRLAEINDRSLHSTGCSLMQPRQAVCIGVFEVSEILTSSLERL